MKSAVLEIRYCQDCQLEVRSVQSIQKKDSKNAKAGSEVHRCPQCNKVLR